MNSKIFRSTCYAWLIAVGIFIGKAHSMAGEGEKEKLEEIEHEKNGVFYELPEDDSWMVHAINKRNPGSPRIEGPVPNKCRYKDVRCLQDWTCCSWHCPWPEFRCN